MLDTRTSRFAFLLFLPGVIGAGCSAHPGRTTGATALHDGEPAGSRATRDSANGGPGNPRTARLGRTPLGEPVTIPLETSMEPALGSRSFLFVSQLADERGAFVRHMDHAGQIGPVISLSDEHVVAAVEDSGERWSLVTSDGVRLCVATYAGRAATPDSRGCAEAAADALAPVGDRIAFIEAHVARPPPPPPPPTTPKVPAHVAKKTHRAPRAHPLRKPAAQKHAKPTTVRKQAPKLKAEVLVRWATRAGTFESAPASSGLRFERPLEGMTLIGAAPRPDGVQIAWYEWDPSRRATKGGLGSARVVTGMLRADGSFDAQSRAAALEGDLEFGSIRNHAQPRLVAANGSVLLVDAVARAGGCTAIRLAPALAILRPAAPTCAVDPMRIAGPAVPADEVALFEKILGYHPRRAPAQPKHDTGLVAWTDDRGYFYGGDDLRSAARADAAVRDEPAPIVAHRARIAWDAIARDGEGIALVEGRLYRVERGGEIASVDGFDDSAPPNGSAAQAGKLGKRALAALRSPSDRPRAARIGSSWWIAQGDVVRVWPSRGLAESLAARAHPDASALLGGAERGMFVEVIGGRLRSTPLDAQGTLGAVADAASPVRVGFAAVERAKGGALIAGVSTTDGSKVVAFALEADGRVARVNATTLPIAPGELAVRLLRLPQGGAVLSDAARKHAVWLDDDGRELASAPWPSESSAAACLDGNAARTMLPTPEAGVFVRVSDLAAPGTCVVGDPIWASDGTLRWFGSKTSGPDAQPEIGILKLRAPMPVVSPSEPAPAAAGPVAAAALSPACPAEMVLAANKFCIDRFEATLFDGQTGDDLSPDFSPTPGLFDLALSDWATGRWYAGDLHARAWPLPRIPLWQRSKKLHPVAASRMGVVPNGYVTAVVAESACVAAGKRLCSYDEFVTACRGEDDTLFPYGDSFVDGACNVYREEHPAALLHGNASIGHVDPRLNRVTARGLPLLRATGATPTCRSVWGDDAVYDLVGNLDEWVDDGGGAFAGGFYSRSTRSGCEAVITAHPRHYADYSTGFRCCHDAAGVPSPGKP